MARNVDLNLDAQSFDTLYDTTITPAMVPFETERQALVRWFWTLLVGAAAVTAVAALIAWIMFRNIEAPRAALLIFVGALPSASIASTASRSAARPRCWAVWPRRWD